jgi:hypothetical protein
MAENPNVVLGVSEVTLRQLMLALLAAICLRIVVADDMIAYPDAHPG